MSASLHPLLGSLLHPSSSPPGSNQAAGVHRSLPRLAGVLLAMAAASGLHAQTLSSLSASTLQATHQEVWMTVADAQLDRMRGGFDVGGGLMVSLGIQQATYINGQLLTQTSIPLTQLSQLNSAQAAVLRERLSALTVVQNGPGNRWGNIQSPSDGSALVTDVAGAGLGSVIQNSLNNQHIQSLTTIGVRSNALELMQSGSWMQSLRESMNSAMGNMR